MALNFTMSDLQYMDNDEWFQYAGSTNSYTDLGLVVGKMSKPLSPQVQEQTQDVPGMYGNIFNGNDYGELTFTIPVTLMAFDHTSYNIIIENLRNMFTADSRDPGIEYPLIFGDRPEVKYYGHWGQISDPTFLTPNDWQASATLTFICSRPYGYLDQQTIHLTHPDQPIIPKGNASTYPVYQIHLNKDIYGIGFNSVNNGGEYVATGYQQDGNSLVSVDANNTDDEGNRLQDNKPLDDDEEPTELSDWITDGTENSQLLTFRLNGVQDGKMGENNSGGICPAPITRVDKNRKYNQSQQTLDYGDPKKHGSEPYGPLAIHPQFDNPTDDWQLMVELYNQKTSTDHSSDRAMGRNNIYLLDENGHRRGMIWIHDWEQGRMPRVGVTLGRNNDDEVYLFNENDKGKDSAIGPVKIKGHIAQRDRGQSGKGYVITSLKTYKKAVKYKKKAKKRKVRKSLRKTKKKKAKRRRSTEIAASRAKYGNGRHVRHHYKKGRKGR